MTNKEKLNNFFVSCFNSILRAEEDALETITNGKLTIKEIHFIEHVFKTRERGENTFSNIADALGVTLGTLMASFSRLEKKGYLTKEPCTRDKRTSFVIPTHLAEFIYQEHTNFHNNMIDAIVATLKESEIEQIVYLLERLARFISKYKSQ
jgi:DNA-binding MarR family transcriptional regulator